MQKRIQKPSEKRVRYIDYTADRQKEQLYKPNGKSFSRALSVVQVQVIKTVNGGRETTFFFSSGAADVA